VKRLEPAVVVQGALADFRVQLQVEVVLDVLGTGTEGAARNLSIGWTWRLPSQLVGMGAPWRAHTHTHRRYSVLDANWSMY